MQTMYHTNNLDGETETVYPIEGNDFLGVDGEALAVVADNEKDIHLFRPDGDGIEYVGVFGKYAFTEHDQLSSTFKSDLLEYVEDIGFDVTNVA